MDEKDDKLLDDDELLLLAELVLDDELLEISERLEREEELLFELGDEELLLLFEEREEELDEELLEKDEKLDALLGSSTSASRFDGFAHPDCPLVNVMVVFNDGVNRNDVCPFAGVTVGAVELLDAIDPPTAAHAMVAALFVVNVTVHCPSNVAPLASAAV